MASTGGPWSLMTTAVDATPSPARFEDRHAIVGRRTQLVHGHVEQGFAQSDRIFEHRPRSWPTRSSTPWGPAPRPSPHAGEDRQSVEDPAGAAIPGRRRTAVRKPLREDLRRSTLREAPSQTQQGIDPFLIEPHYGLPVDDDHRGALESTGQQVLQRVLILPDVLFHEINALSRKILLLAMTRRSTGLGKQQDGFCHGCASRARSPSPFPTRSAQAARSATLDIATSLL